jgi:ATP-dependent Clp protease ATP-binding subunit ClpA
LFGKLVDGGKVRLTIREDALKVETEAAEKLPVVVE